MVRTAYATQRKCRVGGVIGVVGGAGGGICGVVTGKIVVPVGYDFFGNAFLHRACIMFLQQVDKLANQPACRIQKPFQRKVECGEQSPATFTS